MRYRKFTLKIKNYIRLMRPKQWIKNSFVFAPLLFSVLFLKPQFVFLSLWAFVSFCLVSSTIYVMNDLIDMEKDKGHPQKRERPLASGLISKKEGAFFFLLLLFLNFLFSFKLDYSFLGILSLYFLNNILYSFYLKNKVILDVMSIAFGFILRVLGGAMVIAVWVSPWLLLCTLFLSLFLGFSKRRHELILLKDKAGDHRKILKEYSLEFIDNMLSVLTSSIFIGYFLYTFHKAEALMLTIPFVLYGIFRYQYILYHKKEGGSPEDALISDKPLLINIFCWILVSGGILLFI